MIPFFGYPEPICKVIYTTNAVESLNAQLRQVTKRRGAFPTEDSVWKVLYLAISRAGPSGIVATLDGDGVVATEAHSLSSIRALFN